MILHLVAAWRRQADRQFRGCGGIADRVSARSLSGGKIGATLFAPGKLDMPHLGTIT